MRSLNLDMKSNFADRVHSDRMHHTSISAEQKKSKSSLFDDALVRKESSTHDIDDHVGRMKMPKINVDISKRGNSYGSLTKDAEDTEIQLFGKDQSISSGNLTQKIHSRSESWTDRNATHKKHKVRLSKGDTSVHVETTIVDKPSVKNSNAAQQGDHHEYVRKGNQHPEVAAVREPLMSVRLKHVDDIVSDNEDNDKANKAKQPVIDIKSHKKHSIDIGTTYNDSSSLISQFKNNGGSPGIAKESPGDSFSSVLGRDESQKVSTSPSVIVWQER